ncbi:hypothetical protein WA026_016038 [Henosepilachna vigintioctopunctata]|uniref:Uncharacterized protein n=1 Tax=Henosepilachna vigintioctopunctata TaxID=420089 RepID=A0AAW1U8J8_9CUCU
MHKALFAVLVMLMVSIINTRNIRRKSNRDVQSQEYYNVGNFDEVHDLKQNGSENLMFDVDGVNVVIAPANTLFQSFFSPMAVLSLLDEFSRKAAVSLENRETHKDRGKLTESHAKKPWRPTKFI